MDPILIALHIIKIITAKNINQNPAYFQAKSNDTNPIPINKNTKFSQEYANV